MVHTATNTAATRKKGGNFAVSRLARAALAAIRNLFFKRNGVYVCALGSAGSRVRAGVFGLLGSFLIATAVAQEVQGSRDRLLERRRRRQVEARQQAERERLEPNIQDAQVRNRMEERRVEDRKVSDRRHLANLAAKARREHQAPGREREAVRSKARQQLQEAQEQVRRREFDDEDSAELFIYLFD